jgi:hypothetical protein
MAKKLAAGKSTGRKRRAPARQHGDKNPTRKGSSSAVERDQSAGQGPTRPEEELSNQGIPEEHYYGERLSRTPGNPGSLDDETLSNDAPYNRTYGRQEPAGG